MHPNAGELALQVKNFSLYHYPVASMHPGVLLSGVREQPANRDSAVF